MPTRFRSAAPGGPAAGAGSPTGPRGPIETLFAASAALAAPLVARLRFSDQRGFFVARIALQGLVGQPRSIFPGAGLQRLGGQRHQRLHSRVELALGKLQRRRAHQRKAHPGVGPGHLDQLHQVTIVVAGLARRRLQCQLFGPFGCLDGHLHLDRPRALQRAHHHRVAIAAQGRRVPGQDRSDRRRPGDLGGPINRGPHRGGQHPAALDGQLKLLPLIQPHRGAAARFAWDFPRAASASFSLADKAASTWSGWLIICPPVLHASAEQLRVDPRTDGATADRDPRAVQLPDQGLEGGRVEQVDGAASLADVHGRPAAGRTIVIGMNDRLQHLFHVRAAQRRRAASFSSARAISALRGVTKRAVSGTASRSAASNRTRSCGRRLANSAPSARGLRRGIRPSGWPRCRTPRPPGEGRRPEEVFSRG